MAYAMSDINNVPASPANGYFVDQKKGEVNELKQVTFLSTHKIKLSSFKRAPEKRVL